MGNLVKVIAQVDYSVNITCPHCDRSIDLISDDNCNYDDDSVVSRQFFTNSRDGWEDIGLEFTCHHCDGEFELDSLEY
ncbi:hypothetical protein VPHK394_0067 [Vibrio phage K394]